MRKTTAKKATKKVAATKAAPAKKAAAKKVAAKKVAVKQAPAPQPPVAATPAPKPPVAKKAAAKKAPAKKAVAKKAVVKQATPMTTRIIAKVDAGFGNSVFLRGSGSGLLWDQGVAMENVAPDEWAWTSTAVTSELEFKVLINDEIWSEGQNGVVFPGATVVFEPVFA